MQRSVIARVGILIAMAVAFVTGGSAPAHAQVIPLNGLIDQGATDAMIDNLKSHKHVDVQSTPAPAGGAAANDAVPPPITDSDQTKAMFLLPAIDYQADIGINYGEGPTGSIRGAEEGTVNAGVLIRVEPRTRIALAYYQLSTNELGLDTGTLPVNIQGIGTLANEPLNSFQPDPSTKVSIYVAAIERLFTIDKSPLVAALAYDSESSLVDGARLNLDVYFDGVSKNIPIRTAQHYNLVVAEPFVLNDQKLFIVFSEQVRQLVHQAGFNQGPNHPNLQYSAFFQYDINEKASFFLEPAKNVEEFATDRYPQNQAVFVYGVTYKLRKPFFFQASVTDLTTTNPDYDGVPGQIGITRITIPCPGGPTTAACKSNIMNQKTEPTFGGTKLATINLSLGIGTPPVYIPF